MAPEMFSVSASAHDASLIDDDNAVADRLHLLEDVGGQDDRVVLAEPADQPADLDDLLGVKSHGRFVENDDLGVSDERLGDADFSGGSLGKTADEAVSSCRRS